MALALKTSPAKRKPGRPETNNGTRYLIASDAAKRLKKDLGNFSKAIKAWKENSDKGVAVADLPMYVKAADGLFYPVGDRTVEVVDMTQFGTANG